MCIMIQGMAMTLSWKQRWISTQLIPGFKPYMGLKKSVIRFM